MHCLTFVQGASVVPEDLDSKIDFSRISPNIHVIIAGADQLVRWQDCSASYSLNNSADWVSLGSKSGQAIIPKGVELFLHGGKYHESTRSS